METNKIYQGDCIEELKKLDENSIDAVITDPPYGLEFMGKDWDKFGVTEARAKRLKGIDNKGSGDKFFDHRDGASERGRYSEMNIGEKTAMQIFMQVWAKECLRVLKPGGFLLSFGGTRTYHRLVCGIEDAGFEIRDTIMWLYGSGFPKSLNIGKQVDKIQGNKRESKGIVKGMGTRPNVLEFADRPIKNKFELTEGSSEWEGWGTGLKPAVEPIVVARKPLSEKNVALNVLKWGTGGINIDECRVGTDDKLGGGANTKGTVAQHEGYRRPWMDNPEKIKEHIEKTKKNVIHAENLGRFPANIILECTCDNIIKGKKKPQKQGCVRTSKDEVYDLGFKKKEGYVANAPDNYGDSGDVHTNPNCPCYLLDEQSGISKSKKSQRGEVTGNKIFGKYNLQSTERGHNDKGGASRFFYCAKASKGERNFGCENFEPKLRANANKIMRIHGIL